MIEGLTSLGMWVCALLAGVKLFFECITLIPKVTEALRHEGTIEARRLLMKRGPYVVVFVAFLGAFLFLAQAAESQEAPDTRIVVPPFANKSSEKNFIDAVEPNPSGGHSTVKVEQYSHRAAEMVGEVLAEQRGASKSFAIIAGEDIRNAIIRLDMANSPLHDESTQLKIGQFLSANRIIQGRIDKASVRDENLKVYGNDKGFVRVAKVTFSIKSVDVERNTILEQKSFSGSAKDLDSQGNENLRSKTEILNEAIDNALKRFSEDTEFLQALTK